MGSKYTDAQKKASNEYMKKMHTIRVVVTKEKAAEYKSMAEAEGKSVNQFIIDKIEGQN